MKIIVRSLAVLLSLFPFSSVFAGGAIKTDINGVPLRWEGNIVFNADKGGLKNDNDAYNHAATVQIINEAFGAWTSTLAPVGGGVSFSEGPGIPSDSNDVDSSNYLQFFGVGKEDCYDNNPDTPCVSPVIFDADGEIIDDLFGSCAKFSILGFAGFDDIEDGSGDPAKAVVKRGQALFSGACIEPAEAKAGCGSCKRLLSDQEARTIITHEIGHLLGMDHSQVNPGSFLDCVRSGGCPAAVAQDIPTMFPILVEGSAMLDLHQDDIAYFQRLYGNANQGFCSATGQIFANDGKTPVRGVEVLARNLDTSLRSIDAMSFVSGAEAPRITNSNKNQANCKSGCGDYELTGLAPGVTYQICVQHILSQFSRGSSIEPLDPPFQGVEDDCPAGLTVTCDCPSGGACPNFDGLNVVTNVDPGALDDGADDPQMIDPDAGSGGCNLMPRRATESWTRLVLSFRTKWGIHHGVP